MQVIYLLAIFPTKPLMLQNPYKDTKISWKIALAGMFVAHIFFCMPDGVWQGGYSKALVVARGREMASLGLLARDLRSCVVCKECCFFSENIFWMRAFLAEGCRVNGLIYSIICVTILKSPEKMLKKCWNSLHVWIKSRTFAFSKTIFYSDWTRIGW